MALAPQYEEPNCNECGKNKCVYSSGMIYCYLLDEMIDPKQVTLTGCKYYE